MSADQSEVARYAAVLSKLTDLTQSGSLEWQADAVGETPASFDPTARDIVRGEKFSASWKGDDLTLATKKADVDLPGVLRILSPEIALYVRESGTRAYQNFPPLGFSNKLSSHLLDLYRAVRSQHTGSAEGFMDRVLES